MEHPYSIFNNQFTQFILYYRLFKNDKNSDDELHQSFQINKKKGWSIRKAWNMLQKISDEELENYILPVLYRPFDIQWIFYNDTFIERPRTEVMRHMMQENLGLITTRFVFKKRQGFHHAFVSNNILDINQLQSPGTAQLSPLYLYQEEGSNNKMPNISPETIKSLTETYGKQPSPEEIFYYIYGVLYSDIYRKKYAEFLKIDFPRIPFTKDHSLFVKIAELGKRLVDLHLLKSPELENPIGKCQGEGDSRVEKPVYNEKEKRVYINGIKYFEEIEKEVWDYQIGGYQVMDKWLKDRKGRTLSYEDIVHYCKIATALHKTIETQTVLDSLYNEISSFCNFNIKEKGVL